MTVLLIILAVLEFLAILYFALATKTPETKTVYDMKQNYMEVVNEFLNREFNYEIHSRLSGISHVVGTETKDPAMSAIHTITEINKLRDNIAGIKVNIESRMSPEIKKAFYRVYSKDNDVLSDYIIRYIFFRIRHLTADIAAQMQLDQSKVNTDGSPYRSLTNPAQDAMLRQEFEIFNDMGITANVEQIIDNSKEVANSLAATKIQ
jgi:hypothetical protein